MSLYSSDIDIQVIKNY